MLMVGVQDEIIQKARVSENQGFTVTAALADQAAVELSKVLCLQCKLFKDYNLRLLPAPEGAVAFGGPVSVAPKDAVDVCSPLHLNMALHCQEYWFNAVGQHIIPQAPRIDC